MIIHDAARLTGLSEHTIRRRIADGEIVGAALIPVAGSNMSAWDIPAEAIVGLKAHRRGRKPQGKNQ